MVLLASKYYELFGEGEIYWSPPRCLNKPLANRLDKCNRSPSSLESFFVIAGRSPLAERTDYAGWQIWECLSAGEQLVAKTNDPRLGRRQTVLCTQSKQPALEQKVICPPLDLRLCCFFKRWISRRLTPALPWAAAVAKTTWNMLLLLLMSCCQLWARCSTSPLQGWIFLQKIAALVARQVWAGRALCPLNIVWAELGVGASVLSC